MRLKEKNSIYNRTSCLHCPIVDTINNNVYIYNADNNCDTLSDETLETLLDLINKIRLSTPKKTIWLYTGYTWEQLFNGGVYTSWDHPGLKRRNIVKHCDVLVDGLYIEELRDITLPFKGSSNQRVIDIQKSLQEGEVILWNN